MDTGINIKHVDFGGRAIWGLTAPDNEVSEDGNGHGTHVSSTIGGSQYGVAKNVTLIAVKVLRSSGYGSMADVIKGVSWTASEHQRKSQAAGRPAKSIANMSLGGGKSTALDQAVTGAINAGVLFVVAAGNDNQDACNSSPAGASGTLTVGSVTKFDSRSSFSNYGKCVDIFAPGSDITGAWIGSTTAVKTISGTSMASPHVAGVMAMLASQCTTKCSVNDLKYRVLMDATPNRISNPGTESPNRLAYLAPINVNGEQLTEQKDESLIESLKFHIQLE